ncbi:MAG: Ldh family oxidoreductase [Dongiaceae bacterium]
MLIGAAALEALTGRIFAAAGCAPDEAACVARHLVDSNLCGHDSHGVLRIPRYLALIRDGVVHPGRRGRVLFESATALVIDGEMGLGQVIVEDAMTRLAAKAKASGMALATIRNCGHAGRLGDWAEQLAGHDLISLHFLKTVGLGAIPFGGSDRRLALNPLAACVPVPGRPPVLLDVTTTTVAEGKLAVARNKGERVPPGTIVDKHGQPTTDPNDFYAGGALLTMGGHKGYGLNVITDLLTGGLSGGGCTGPGETKLVNTVTALAIDPTPFTDRQAYVAEIVRYLDWVKGSPPSQPGGEVLLPGEIEHRTRQDRRAGGVPLDDATWRQIVEGAATVGIDEATLRADAA